MDFGFDFETSGFETEIEDFEVKKVKKFDRGAKAKPGGSVHCTPAIHNGIVYFGACDNYFYSVDGETGEEKWRFRTGDHVQCEQLPLIHKGKIYFSSWDNNVYGLDCETGKEIWRFRTGKLGASGAPVLHKNLLIFGSREGILYAADINTAEEVWRFNTGKIMMGASIKGNKAYFGSEDNNFYCLDADTGKEIWRFETSHFTYGRPSFYNEMVFVASWDCHVYALDCGSGKEMWRFAANSQQFAYQPPPHKEFEMVVKKETHIDDAISEDRYKSKKREDTISLSDYQITSEYATTSEYNQKSDYDTSFVIFEDILEQEEPAFGQKLRTETNIKV